MKIAPYVERLNSSQEYSKFAKEHRDAFMIAGFFVLDYEAGKNMHQIDYYVPSKRKIAAFTLDHGVTMQLLGALNKKVPEKLDIKTKIDLDALKGILEDEMKNRTITEDIKKIIAVVQNLEGKKTWNLNCVLSGMGILRANIDDESSTVLKMEKSSIMDYVKKVSPQQLAEMKGKMQGTETQQPTSKDGLKKELSNLESMEKEIEVEKANIKKKMNAEKINKDLAKALKSNKNSKK